MKNVLNIILLLGICFLAACGNNAYSDQKSYEASDKNGDGMMAYAQENSLEEAEQNSDFKDSTQEDDAESDYQSKLKIIKTGRVGITVNAYPAARTGLDVLLKKYSAYISNEDETRNRYSIQNTLVIRMPSDKFDGFLEEVGGLAEKVEYKNVSAEDVSMKYVDLTTRLALKKNVRNKYEGFLKNAKNVEEMLAVEEKIRMLTEEIEAKEAELRYLSDQVKFSTLTLTMTQNIQYSYEENDYTGPGFFERLGKALGNGWQGVLTFFIGLATIWPLLLIVLVLFLGVWRFIKKTSNRSKTKNVE